MYCFVAVNTRHPSVWLGVDLQSISESSHSLQQQDCFLMSSLWMKGGLQARAIFWHRARDKHCLLESEQGDGGPLNCFSPTGSSQANCDHGVATSSLKHLCSLWVIWGYKIIQIIQICTTFWVMGIRLVIILKCPAI